MTRTNQMERGDAVRARLAALVAERPDTWTVDDLGRELGLTRTTLYYHLVRLGIRPPRSTRLKPATIERNARAARARERREAAAPAPPDPEPESDPEPTPEPERRWTVREAAAACAAEIERCLEKRA